MHEVMIKEIIPAFPKSEQGKLREAANSWRFPYWDWAAKKPQESGEPNYDVPKLVRLEEVEVRVPGGTARVPNPFYQFRMPNDMSMGDPRLRANAVTKEPVRPFNRLSPPAAWSI